ncbi:MAG: hypothetical protein JWN57_1437 [Frankiales bacterium]|jgi:phospholipid/cholesterol/gamma-HCH transport system substrate-binding protein|nr:hypothetical protein [Frankiales bacterium]
MPALSARLRPAAAGVAGLLVLFAAGQAAAGGLTGGGYEVTVVMPSAPNLVKGGKVEVDGADAGRVQSLEVRDGQALVTVSIADEYAPLRTGTTARIEWKALLGERTLVIEPGPASNPDLPDRGRVEGSRQRVELDQLLAALDAPTRARLQRLTQNLAATLRGSEDDVNGTLRTAGPVVQALGGIAASVGRDGEALKSLVTRLRDVTDVTTTRRQDVRAVVADLTSLTQRAARERSSLDATLAALPGTLRQATSTLDRVPGTVAAADPLLRDAAPLAAQLPAVSADLRPLLQDLRPALQDLRPTLNQVSVLLDDAPRLLDGANAVLPGLTQLTKGALPALDFLRPYTPEVTGWLANWGSATANYDVYGNYTRIYVQAGPASVLGSPGALGPALGDLGLVKTNPQRQPGELEGQPWTDANGSPIR